MIFNFKYLGKVPRDLAPIKVENRTPVKSSYSLVCRQQNNNFVFIAPLSLNGHYVVMEKELQLRILIYY